MKRQYRLYELEDTEFEDLVCRICVLILGMGTIGFSAGKDGGRDARFNGTAAQFPSPTKPASGKFVVQAKHTTHPFASCSDKAFQTKVFDAEIPKIERLAQEGELEFYILFTNRNVTGGTEKKLVKKLRRIKGITVFISNSETTSGRFFFPPLVFYFCWGNSPITKRTIALSIWKIPRGRSETL